MYIYYQAPTTSITTSPLWHLSFFTFPPKITTFKPFLLFQVSKLYSDSSSDRLDPSNIDSTTELMEDFINLMNAVMQSTPKLDLDKESKGGYTDNKKLVAVGHRWSHWF